jgi:amino acid transporter
MRIVVQFIGQAIGVMLLRKQKGSTHLPYKMPLYPLPVVLAVLMWLFVFYATGLTIIASFLLVFGSGVLVYFLFAKYTGKWPYVPKPDDTLEDEVRILGDNL